MQIVEVNASRPKFLVMFVGSTVIITHQFLSPVRDGTTRPLGACGTRHMHLDGKVANIPSFSCLAEARLLNKTLQLVLSGER